jgi:hypothetical protein
MEWRGGSSLAFTKIAATPYMFDTLAVLKHNTNVKEQAQHGSHIKHTTLKTVQTTHNHYQNCTSCRKEMHGCHHFYLGAEKNFGDCMGFLQHPTIHVHDPARKERQVRGDTFTKPISFE